MNRTINIENEENADKMQMAGTVEPS